VRVRLLSKVTPRLRTTCEGDKAFPLKVTEDEMTLARWQLVPTKRYSVFAGFTIKRFEDSQECTASRVDDR
jgi:hypothetical protein